MENASKALIIAGAILLSILIIGLGMFVYQQAAGAMDGIGMESEKAQAYNQKFLNYEGTQSGTKVKSLLNELRNHNNGQDDTSRQIGIDVQKDKSVKSPTKPKNEDNIEEEVSMKIVSDIRAEIQSGKTYKVEFVTDKKSGYIISILITRITE